MKADFLIDPVEAELSIRQRAAGSILEYLVVHGIREEPPEDPQAFIRQPAWKRYINLIEDNNKTTYGIVFERWGRWLLVPDDYDRRNLKGDFCFLKIYHEKTETLHIAMHLNDACRVYGTHTPLVED